MPAPQRIAPPELAQKVRFLGDPASYRHRPRAVRVVETNMSFVFLAGPLVFKIKKPVRFPYLDFSTLEARAFFVAEELRLNRALAPQVYLRAQALRRDASGALTLDPEGAVADWLVVMRRLPAARMLDAVLRRGGAGPDDIAAVAQVLADFFARAAPQRLTPDAYLGRLTREHAETVAVLQDAALGLPPAEVAAALDHFAALLQAARPLLEARVRDGRIVEGHGDLRPEHVCLTDPIAVIDRLEFDRALRLVDPFEEIAFLGMECARLGAPWAHAILHDRLAAALGDQPPALVVRLHWANRALLRARLALAHLRASHPRTPRKWRPLARRYLALAIVGPPTPAAPPPR
jgi:aminoglycoside phosphotransferase family enzyme